MRRTSSANRHEQSLNRTKGTRPHGVLAAAMTTATAAGAFLFALAPARAAEPPSVPPPVADVEAMMCEVSADAIRRHVDQLASFGTRHTLSQTESETRGIGAARRYILREFEQSAAASGRAGRDQMRVYFDPHTIEPDGGRITREVEVVNVVAEIPGATPEGRERRYYVLGHYDSRASNASDFESDAPGANDDASGVALLMELARVMSKERFDATLVFMATAGEEQGLYGAARHAEKAKANGWDVRAVLNNDTVGDPTDPLDPDDPEAGRVRVFSTAIPQDADDREIAGIRRLGAEIDSPSRQVARYIRSIANQYESWANEPPDCDGDSIARADQPAMVMPMMIFRTDRFLRGGDHTAFNRAGFPGVRFCEVAENYDRQHQDVRLEDGVQFGDLPEYVDEDYVAAVARLNLASLAHLARAPRRPADARIIVARLENETRLRWTASPEPDVAGYEIVWRETASPFWTHVEDVGAVTEATLPVSKDNHFFGVRAYDRDGYRSPVAFTGASRR